MPVTEMTESPLPAAGRKITLQELSPKHKQVAALLAQGVDRASIAEAVGFAPEYITWLGGDPLFIQYVKEMSKLAGTQLEAMFVKSVEVIGDQLLVGSGEEKLKAARLQLEATGRLGKGGRALGEDEEGAGRLERLADRLLQLQRQRQGVTINGQARVVTDG